MNGRVMQKVSEKPRATKGRKAKGEMDWKEETGALKAGVECISLGLDPSWVFILCCVQVYPPMCPPSAVWMTRLILMRWRRPSPHPIYRASSPTVETSVAAICPLWASPTSAVLTLGKGE